MSEIKKCSGRTHRPKRPGGNNIDFFECTLFTQFADDIRHLLCRYDPDAAVPDTVVDRMYGLLHDIV